MTTGSDVGVVIPTYERVDETVRAVRSVLAQTVPATELVVVDDGSPGDAPDKLEAALAELPVTFVRARHTGHPGRARNTGMERLETRWVAFLDSDDTWHPTKLEKQLSAASEGAVAVCTNARRIVDGVPDGNVLAELPATLGIRDLVRENKVINSSVLIRRDVLAEVHGIASSYQVRGCEDYATWLRVATRYDWSGLSEPLVDYIDEPTVSIRGSEEFAVHPGQQAAWLDYVMWRRAAGSPVRLPEKVLSGVLRRALLLQAGGPSRKEG